MGGCLILVKLVRAAALNQRVYRGSVPAQVAWFDSAAQWMTHSPKSLAGKVPVVGHLTSGPRNFL